MFEISIQKLFGHFDYHICIRKRQITILTGPNGFGKSTIIRFIYAIGSSDLSIFFETVYDTIEIKPSNQTGSLIITAKDGGILFNGRKITHKNFKYFSRGTSPAGISGDEEKKKFSEEQDSYKKILQIMRNIFGDVSFISEHRVVMNTVQQVVRFANIRKVEKDMAESIEEIPEKLGERIQEAERNYSSISNELDSTFPKRLFSQKDGISEKDFHASLRLMHERVQKLQNNGFTRIHELNDMAFQPEDARALKVYFDDFDRKYQVYESILNKMELFQDIVSRRFLFKRLKLSSTSGILVMDEASGHRIPLSRLSSGEKEILILFYNLLFENADGAVVLVDEPEISLHIAWQRMFIDDLRKIALLRNLTVILATHSPQIINGNRHIQIDLGELYKNGLNQGK